jgi:hypothetical protein
MLCTPAGSHCQVACINGERNARARQAFRGINISAFYMMKKSKNLKHHMYGNNV